MKTIVIDDQALSEVKKSVCESMKLIMQCPSDVMAVSQSVMNIYAMMLMLVCDRDEFREIMTGILKEIDWLNDDDKERFEKIFASKEEQQTH